MIVANARRPALAVIGGLALAASLLTSVPALAASDHAAALDFSCRVNAERSTRGGIGLRVASDLTQVAQRHSARMADENLLHHNPKLGSEVTGWTRIAENVGRGSSVSSIHAALMASDGHRRNILESQVSEMGIAVEWRGGTAWVTQIFRRPTSSTSAPWPDCGTSTPPTSMSASPVGYPVVGDWNGDRQATQGRFHDGQWRLRDRAGSTTTINYGRAGDLPIAGDWNGDGRDTLGIIRDGEWHLRNSLSSGSSDISFDYGRITRGDIPIAGDWNGDGKDGIGIIRDGEWHLRNSLAGGNSEIQFTYGRLTRGDVPLIGDWNGNQRDTIGIVRNGEWHLRNSLSGGNGQVVFTYGRVLRGDVPIIGDWNRSGRSGIGIVRGTDWHLRDSLSAGSAQRSLRY